MGRIPIAALLLVIACSSADRAHDAGRAQPASHAPDAGAKHDARMPSTLPDAMQVSADARVPRGDASVSHDGGANGADAARADASTPLVHGPAPSWFSSAAEGEWIAVASASDQTIRHVLPDPVPHVDGAPDNPGSITDAWTSGGVDQVRGELLLVANGGHADYPGNEGYAISLRQDAPVWRRLSDPTPNAMLSTGPAGPTGALNQDGRPRAMHSTFACFGDDRMWFPYDNSYTSPAGDSTSACFSYNRAYPGLPDVGGKALPWSGADLGPWSVHPNPNANWTAGFGSAAWDRVGHKIWALGGNNNVNDPQYWSVETTGADLGKSTLYKVAGSIDNFNGWVVVAHDLRILVAGGSYSNALWVLSLERAGQADAWQHVMQITGTGFYESGAGGAYLQSNHTIAVGNPKTTGNAIYRLRVPTKLDGQQRVYDAAGMWEWTKLEPGGASIAPPKGNGDVHGKWNIVDDMGNGQSALVCVDSIDGPVYVLKVPSAGL